MLSLTAASAMACGAFNYRSYNPFNFHFSIEEVGTTVIDEQRRENIALWQKLTSDSVSSADIEAAVYHSTLADLRTAFGSGKSDNMLLSWIIANRAQEAQDFLLLAKEVEELRHSRMSKWFYPADKDDPYESEDEARSFAGVMERCRSHSSGPLADRYGLQYVRILMSLEKYDECFNFFDTNMSPLPDNNLFKRMAKGYVAGCLQRMGQTQRADRMFAEVGDYNSILGDKKSHLVTLVRNNPESDVVKEQLNWRIGRGDRDYNHAFLAIADAALASPYTVHRGDWLYLKAYIVETYDQNHTLALDYLNRALHASFSTGMQYSAETMKLCLEAQQGKLCHDLGRYLDAFDTDAIFLYIVPALLKQGRIPQALLLANYASAYQTAADDAFFSFTNNSIAQKAIVDHTYATTGFQLMLARSAREVIEYKNYLASADPLVRRSIGTIRHDDDYLNELIGTLHLREGNYTEAEKYLAQVSDDYQENLNVKKCGYLFDNPWADCYMPADKWEYPADKNEPIDSERALLQSFNPSDITLLNSDRNAKLNFARRMVLLEQTIGTGEPDLRGLATIRHAMARYNSFHSAWALTQYWLGDANQCNYQPAYWTWDGHLREVNYLKQPQFPDDKWLAAEIEKGFRMLRSPDAVAEAEFLMGNYRTIAKRYPHTPAARYLAAHCDHWADWL